MSSLKVHFIFLFSVVCATLATDSWAFARVGSTGDFQVSVPGTWKKIESSFPGNIYRNTKSKFGEAIVAVVYPVGPIYLMGPDELFSVAQDLTALRAESFARMGMGNYALLSAQKKILKNQKATALVTIEARYHDLRKREVQSIERQYFTGDKIYQVIYIAEGSAITNRERVRLLLDSFQPTYRTSREPASTDSVNSAVSQPQSEQTCADCSSNVTTPPPIKGGTEEMCMAVDEKDRRTNYRYPIGVDEFVKLYDTGVGCFKSFDWVYDLLKTAIKVAPYTSPLYTAYKVYPKIWKYANDPAYRVEVNATAHAAAEAALHVDEFAEKALFAVGHAVAETCENFTCYNNQKQAKIICSVLQVLVPTGYGLVKMVAKVPLEVAEAEQVANAVKSAVNAETKESKIAKVASEVPKTEPPGGLWYKFAGKNPYLDPVNQAQRKFLERLGVQFDGDTIKVQNMREVARNYNRIIDEMVSRGELKEADVIRWSDTYVGKDGKLIFKPLGEPPPQGAEFFQPEKFKVASIDKDGRTIYRPLKAGEADETEGLGIVSNADFYAAIRDGHFPGAFGGALSNYGLSAREPAFFHDLAHMGGFIDHPDGMSAFRKSIEKATQISSDGVIPKVTERKIFYANELLPAFKPGSYQDLQKAIPWDLQSGGKFKFFKRGPEVLDKMSDPEIENLASQVWQWNAGARSPFGGVSRTGSFNDIAASHLDQMADTVKSTRDSLAYELNYKKQIESKMGSGTRDWTVALADQDRRIDEVRRAAKSSIKKFVDAVKDASQIDIKKVFDLAFDNKPLEKDSPYYRFLCDGRDRPARMYFCGESAR